jgi:hypothetical protein
MLVSTLTTPRSAPASAARSCCAPVRPVLARPAEAPLGCTMGHSRGTPGYSRGTIGYSRAAMGYTSIPHRSPRRRSTTRKGWACMASLRGLERCCEAMQGVLWVLHRLQGVLIGYCRRGTLHACISQPHQAQGGPSVDDDAGTQMFTDVYARGVSVTASAVAAVPTTRAPFATYAPDGAPPWPLRMGRAG